MASMELFEKNPNVVHPNGDGEFCGEGRLRSVTVVENEAFLLGLEKGIGDYEHSVETLQFSDQGSLL